MSNKYIRNQNSIGYRIKNSLPGGIASAGFGFIINYYFLPFPATSLDNAIGHGVGGFISGFISAFLAITLFIIHDKSKKRG